MIEIEDLENAVHTLDLDEATYQEFNKLENVGSEIPDEYGDRLVEYYDGLGGNKARADFLIKIWGADDPGQAVRDFFDGR